MGICRKMRSSINFSVFLNFCRDQASPVSPNSMKSKKKFEGDFVGLGIVAAMNEIKDTREASRSVRVVKTVDSTQSRPIPIVSSKSEADSAFEEPCSSEMSESYTCVIYRVGNIGVTVKKRERFDVVRYESGLGVGDCKGKFQVFSESPLKKKTEQLRVCEFSPDFLSFCYLCRKKLHGLDIFMYRGDQAFCSVECRCKQILKDERRDSHSASKKSLDCAASSPCSTPTLFAAGVAAA